MRISDWSSDVCSSDLATHSAFCEHGAKAFQSAHFADLLHRAFHFLMHFQEPVDLLHCRAGTLDRKSVVEGKSVSVRVDLGGRRIIKNKTTPIDISRIKLQEIYKT